MERRRSEANQRGKEYTHGGVKKTKFEPKVPASRPKKVVLEEEKLEPGEASVRGGGEPIPRELRLLLQQQQQQQGASVTRREIALKFTQSSRSQPPGRGDGGRRRRSGVGEVQKAVIERQGFAQADEANWKVGEVERSSQHFDCEKNYPVTVRLRKPREGDGDESGEEEEEEEEEGEEQEGGGEAADELGLRGITEDGDVFLFFQFPRGLPVSLGEGELRGLRLEEAGRKGGAMGKVLVYESGVVKLRLGSVVLDALPGTECGFAQEVAAVNVASRQCAFLGRVHKRVVVTPNVASLLRSAPGSTSAP